MSFILRLVLSSQHRPNPTSSVPQRTAEGTPQRGTQGIHLSVTSSGLNAKRDEKTSQDSLSLSPKSTDSLNMRSSGDKPRERLHFVQSGNQLQRCSETSIGHWRVAFWLCVRTSLLVRDHSCEDVFPLLVHLHANQTHFKMKAFARGFSSVWNRGSRELGNGRVDYDPGSCAARYPW